MSIDVNDQDAEISRHVTTIVAAYVANNSVQRPDVPALIGLVGEALSRLYTPTQAETKHTLPTQAEISKSITQDFLISFIDGKPYKTLKRHLRDNGFDPYSYRACFGLPSDHPMVAAVYSARRSEVSRNREHWKRKRP